MVLVTKLRKTILLLDKLFIFSLFKFQIVKRIKKVFAN